MELLQIDPARVILGTRLRAVDPDYVALLAESIRARGLDQPIRVTAADAEGRHRLIAGAHRLAAAIEAGLPSIPAIPFSGSELQAELIEIEENLVRRELSEMDKATFLARHKAVWEALHPYTRHGGDGRKRQVDKDVHLAEHPLAERFSAAAAAKMGVDERTIRRAVRRHEALSPAIRARLAGTWIAGNGAALDDLIGRGTPVGEAEQHAMLDLLLDPDSGIRKVNDALRAVRRLPPQEQGDTRLAALKATWRKTSAGGRLAFITFILLGSEPAREHAEQVLDGLRGQDAGEGRVVRALAGREAA